MSKMKDVPTPLRRRFYGSMVAGISCTLFFLLAWFITGELYICLSLLYLALFPLISAWSLYRRCVRGAYVIIKGECVDIEKSGIMKKVRSIYIISDNIRIRIPTQKRSLQVSLGDVVTVYIPEQSPLMPYENYYYISNYYAITAQSAETTEVPEN